MTVSRLAAGTETSGAATTQLVSGLVKAGYVTRSRQSGDNRSVTVALTEAGRARHVQRQNALADMLALSLAEYDDQTVGRTAEILLRLAEIYDQL